MAKYSKGEFVTIPNKSALRGLAPQLQVLFFWLCEHSDDTMTSFPSRATLAAECGMSVKTLDRSVQKLVELGLVVKTTRTNREEHLTNLYEVVIQDTGDTETPGGSVTKSLPSVTQSPGRDKNDIENSIQLTQSKNSIEIGTNVPMAPAEPTTYGKPELNELFEYWEAKTSVSIQAKLKPNRNAANNLLKRYGAEKLHQLIDGVALAQSDRYAPRICDFIELQAKLTQLLTWGKTKMAQPAKVVKI